MKRFIAIVFSLLLIAAQTFVVEAPASGGPSVAKAGCCCDGCPCGVDPDDGSSAAPLAATVPASPGAAFVFLPVAHVLFEMKTDGHSFSASSADTLVLAGSQPLYRLNCALLI